MATDSPVYEPVKIDELTFQFTTESEDVYKCYFISYAFFFSAYPDIASQVYGFNVDLVSGPIKHKGIDRRISFTVVNIVADFLASQVNAVVYVCDPSDGRDGARFKKFKSWYFYAEHPSAQIQQVVSDVEAGGMTLHTALLVHKNNPQKDRFVQAYFAITQTKKQ